jgi:hypothetical protein
MERGKLKFKETNSSTKSKETPNISRILFEGNKQRKEASSSQMSDHSSVHSSPIASQKREISTPHHSEASDHSSPATHPPASPFPSEMMIELEKGICVPARDIHSVEMFRDCCNEEYYKSRKQALIALEKKCQNSAYELSAEDRKKLVEENLIDKDTGQPHKPIKDIVCYLSEKGDLLKPWKKIIQRVKLKNGTDVDWTLTKKIMKALTDVRRSNSQAILGLYKLCDTKNYRLEDATIAEVLKSNELIDENTGQPSESVKAIVLCSFDKESGKLHNPRMDQFDLQDWAKEEVRKAIREKVNLEAECNRSEYKDQVKQLLVKDLNKNREREELNKTILKSKDDFFNVLEEINTMIQKLENLHFEDRRILSSLYPYQGEYLSFGN